jgi:hypothetical protein
MARTIDPKVQERNQRLCSEFQSLPLGDPGTDYATLAYKYAMGKQTVQRVLTNAGLIGRGRPPAKRLIDAERKPLSHFHAVLGAEVSLHLTERQLTREVIEKITDADIATTFGMSTKMFTQLRGGLHDPTLTQLRSIALWMELPLSELISVIQRKMTLYGRPLRSFS